MVTHPSVAGCPFCDTLTRAGAASHAWLIATLPRTYVVLGDNQGCPGWCVAVLKEHAEHLAELDVSEQSRVFRDVARVAGAIRRVFPASGKDGGPPRINYECLGNQVAHVHWHVIPRHADDPEPNRPVWGWDEDRLKGSMSDADRRALLVRLRDALERM